MKKIKAVIFDLDGTLANTLPLCIQSFRQSVEPLINRSISDADRTEIFYLITLPAGKQTGGLA